MFDLPHVASRLYGSPLLVARAKLELLLKVIGPRLTGQQAGKGETFPAAPQSLLRITQDGICVLPVMGTLVRRASGMSALCGMSTYHNIASMAQEAFSNPEVKAVLLEIDSCGGEAGGVFDLVDTLHNLSVQSGKPLWAIADEAALSAAYAIACAADKIYLPRTAEVGSVGVVAVHVDESAADAIEGMKYTYIHAGSHKVDANPHNPLSPEVLAKLQEDVDTLHTEFVALVAKRRGCSAEQIQQTEARIYRGRTAVKAGLADSLGTFSKAYADLCQHCKKLEKQASASVTSPTLLTASPTQDLPMTTEITNPLSPAAETQNKEQLLHTLSNLQDIARQAQSIGVSVDPVKALQDGVSPDALRAQVLQQAAEADKASAVVTSHPVSIAPTPSAGGLQQAIRKMHPVNK